MDKITTYIKESMVELREGVTWPTWDELLNQAALVLVASLLIAGFIFVMDKVINLGLSFIYS